MNDALVTLKIAGWIGLILLAVWYDNKHYATVNHAVGLIVRIFVGILYAGLIFQVRRPDEWAQWVLIWMATSFYFFFEAILNLSVGQAMFYLGRTAWIDKQIHKIGGVTTYVWIKICVVILMLVSSVQLYKMS